MNRPDLVHLYDCGAAHAAADTKCCKTFLSTLCLHLMKQSNKDTASGSTYGMSESNCTTVGI